jgi:hypothetical protein
LAFSYIIPASGSNGVPKPRSFPDTEAETQVSEPPFAQKRSRTGLVFAYSALFANPVKTIFSHLF